MAIRVDRHVRSFRLDRFNSTGYIRPVCAALISQIASHMGEKVTKRYEAILSWAVVAAAVLLFARPLSAAEITRHETARVMVYITGAISPGDDIKFSRLTSDMQAVIVTLESPGGDVATALRLGRLIRAKNATVFSAGCSSACVLLYAAGVRRVGGFDDAAIGVHRIYFAQLESDLSQAQVQLRYSTALSDVRQFLSDMNVASGFLDVMQSIPPERMRLLTNSELEQFGLGKIDAVYEERTIANAAAALGVSSFEYRQRQEKARLRCAATEESSPAGPTPSPRFACEQADIWKVSVQEYLSRARQANEKCRHMPSGDGFRQCFQRVMRALAE